MFTHTSKIPSRSRVINCRKLVNGLTLVELLVAMLLGIFIIGGLISVFLSNQQNVKTNENLAMVQENTRFAFDQLSREVRDAGSNPCGVRAVNSVVRTATGTPWWGDWEAGTLRGYDGAINSPGTTLTFSTSVTDRVTNTDAIVVMRTTNNNNDMRTIASHDIGSNRFTFNTPANINKQDLLFVCDSVSGTIFEAVTPNSTGPNTNITHDSVPPSSNCSDLLGWAPGVNCATNAVTKTFAVGSIITKFDPAIWYIGNNRDGGRSLYRETMHKSSSPDVITTERREIVADVQDMQIQYLTRSNPSATATGTATIPVIATTWVDASTISAQPGDWSAVNSNEAIAVRITLTFQSKEAVGTDGTANTRLQRQTISVISLRAREIAR